MLAVRLTADEEQRVARFARAQGRAKSDVARVALAEYLDRHDGEDEFERSLNAVAGFESSDASVKRDLEGAEATAWRTINKL